jgi:hypothetical protein
MTIIGSVAGAVLPPIIAGAVRTAIAEAMHNQPAATTGAIAGDVIRRLEANPVVVNEVNAEAPYQSRVAVGSVISALGVIVPMLGNLMGFDGGYVMEVIGALITLYGAGFALYGRFASGLKPLQWGFIGRLFGRAAAVVLIAGIGALAGTQRSEAAVCLYAALVEATAQREGLVLAFTARTLIGEEAVPVRIAVDRNGRWVAWYYRVDGLLACPFAEGEAWTPQGEIPAADLRPGLH